MERVDASRGSRMPPLIRSATHQLPPAFELARAILLIALAVLALMIDLPLLLQLAGS
jgi:hypothetical protein